MSESPEPLPRLDDMELEVVDFSDPDIFAVKGISDARWQRAQMAVDVRSLIKDLFGLSGSPISCPFHGRDSKPSFYIFPAENNTWCWGCGEEKGWRDTIRIVDDHFGFEDKVKALKWLESNYPMPPLPEGDSYVAPDIVIVDDLDEEAVAEVLPLLTVETLRGPFVAEARSRVAACSCPGDAVPLAYDLLERLFRSIKQDTPLPLARVIGTDDIRRMLLRH